MATNVYWNANHVAYTYVIGWSDQNKRYYGVRFAKNCHPFDLWSTYFTSSRKVKALRKEYGEPDIIEIRKLFESKEAARKWETEVIRRLNMVKSDVWLNQTDNTGKFFWQGPRGEFSEDHRKNLSEAHKGKKCSPESRRKHAEKVRGQRRPGTRPDTALRHKNTVVSKETRLRQSEAKKSDPETLNRLKKAAAISAQKRALDPDYKRRQSEKAKEAWARRKMENV